MYIVRENDEDKINKAAQLAGERSQKLADTIKSILTLKGDKELSVETIEQAIDVVNGKKKLTHIVQPISYHIRPKEKKYAIELVGWLPSLVKWIIPAEKTCAITASLHDYPCAKMGKDYMNEKWISVCGTPRARSRLPQEKSLERGMILVRNR